MKTNMGPHFRVPDKPMRQEEPCLVVLHGFLIFHKLINEFNEVDIKETVSNLKH